VFLPKHRYGLREGFATKNVDVKHAHDVSMKFQQSTPVSVHENVPNYDEARFEVSATIKSSNLTNIHYDLIVPGLLAEAPQKP